MLPLTDPRWQQLQGGYRTPIDVTALQRLETGDEDAWDELWDELHHQGDVGEASYAAVPHLVRIAAALPARDRNFYGLVSTIEIERHRVTNPPLPDWLRDDYDAAIDELLRLALADLAHEADALTIQSILGAVALARGVLELGA